jgi:pSer/pThr/pTyr-binding forkhead associated (FHA) protein
MMARLVPLAAGSAPEVDLQRPVLLIGRHAECDVRLDSPQISRRHCCVALAYDRIVIRDLGSRNGVRVNGRVVDEQGLRPGDEVAIGHVLFRLELFEPAPARPSPARPSPKAKPRRTPEAGDSALAIPLDD